MDLMLKAVTLLWDVSRKFMRVSSIGNRKFMKIKQQNPSANINDRSGWYTRRGCFKELTSCTDPLTCDTCDSSNNCNRDIFPSDRQTCLKCTNSDCSSPKNEYCSIHLKDSNGCATLFDEGLKSPTNFAAKIKLSIFRRFCCLEKLLC